MGYNLATVGWSGAFPVEDFRREGRQVEGTTVISGSPIRLLLWSESVERLEAACAVFADAGDEFQVTTRAGSLLSAVDRLECDALVCDCSPNLGGSEAAIDAARQAAVPLVLLVHEVDEEAALNLLQRGVTDFVVKSPLQLRRLPNLLQLIFGRNPSQRFRSLPGAEQPSSPEPFSGRVFDGLAAPLAVLDSEGKIVFANPAWRAAANSRSKLLGRCTLGSNYLGLFEAFTGPEQATGVAVAAAIRDVLGGNRESFSLDYPVHLAREQRWYRLLVSASQLEWHRGAIVMHLDVTDRVHVESTVRFQPHALATIDDAVYATDLNLHITAWNSAAEALYGWSPEEVLQSHIRDIVCDPHTPRDAVDAFAVPIAGVRHRTVATHRTRSGSLIAVEITVMPVRNPAGATTGYVSLVRDITEKNLAWSAALANEARLQLTCRAATEAICDLDLRTGRVWRSHGYQRNFGYGPDDVGSGLDWWIAKIHPDDVERVWNAATNMLEHGDDFLAEYRFRRADGSYAFVMHRAFLLKGPQGNPLRVAGTLIDITERRRTEQALAQSEKRYRLLAENSTDMISRHDHEGRFIYTSPAIKTLVGYSPEEMLGTSVYDYVHPDDVLEMRRVLRKETNEPLTLICRARHKNGHLIWIETTARSVQDPSGGGGHEFVCVSRDVTARKQAEDLMRLQQAELAHISRLTSMGEMASGIAHELNQPLTTISHYVDACQRTVARGEHTAERLSIWLEKIGGQVERAGEIIRCIKGFVQKTPPERRDVDPEFLLEEVLELFDPDARLHDIQLVHERGAPLPIVSVDKVQIQQVLVNLLRNAFESLDACQAIDRTVTVRAMAASEDEVVISVEDRGSGVSPEGFTRLFEAFYTTKPDGTGVGLPISRSIIEDHGGQIWATNNRDRGVTFWFTVPTTRGVKKHATQARSIRSGRRSRDSRGTPVNVGNDGT